MVRWAAALGGGLVWVAACSGAQPEGFRSPPDAAIAQPETNETLPVSDAPIGPCATSSAEAAPLPLHLVLVLDQSGSMCQYDALAEKLDCNHPQSRWQQAKGALFSFLGAPASAGIMASLIAFPDGVGDVLCRASTYETPKVREKKLPDVAAFRPTLDALRPAGITPTAQALEGTLTFLRTLGPGRKVIVLATDGYPLGCTNNTIADASQVLSAARGVVPTFVIGVGDELSKLDQLAIAGGTSKAYLVRGTSSALTAALLQALNDIRARSLGCDYALPEPPIGQTLDFKKVNVEWAGADGLRRELPYDPDCSVGGWQYDDEATPTRISICPAVCKEMQAQTEKRVDVVFGCATRVR